MPENILHKPFRTYPQLEGAPFVIADFLDLISSDAGVKGRKSFSLSRPNMFLCIYSAVASLKASYSA